jgi:hypothetical protein
MYGATHADLIYFKPVENGYLYVLKFKDSNGKQHTTMNNYIERLDDTLKLGARTETTFFLSINDDQTLVGSKVLSFDRDGRKENPLYKQLFGAKGLILPHVTVWNKEIADAAELSDENGHNDTSDDDETLNEATVAGNVGSTTSSASNGKQKAVESHQVVQSVQDPRISALDSAVQSENVSTVFDASFHVCCDMFL